MLLFLLPLVVDIQPGGSVTELKQLLLAAHHQAGGKDAAIAMERNGPHVLPGARGIQARARVAPPSGGPYANLLSLSHGSVLAASEPEGSIQVEGLP